MTVNTLGSESRLGGDSVAPGSSRGSRTVAEWLWPFLVGGVALFSISALFYYHFHRAELEPQSFLQQMFAGIYDAFGWAPSVVFCLLVFAWSLIWFVTGVLERPASRVARLLVMAVMLGVFLNLGDGGVASAPHKGAFGAWLAGRLVAAIGYVPSLVIVWITTFASLLLATDWFFSDWFDRSRKASSHEGGVEDEVTEHLRGLADIPGKPESTAAASDEAAGANPAVPAPAPAPASTSAAALREQAAAAAEAATRAEPAGAAEPVVQPETRLSYAERRRLRAERAAAAGSLPVAGAPPEPVVDDAEESGDDAAVTDGELASLFGDGEPAAADADATAPDVVVAPEHREADEVELVREDLGDGVAAAELEDGEEFEADAEVAEADALADDEEADEDEAFEDDEEADEDEDLEDGEEVDEDEELEDDEEADEGEELEDDEDQEAVDPAEVAAEQAPVELAAVSDLDDSRRDAADAAEAAEEVDPLDATDDGAIDDEETDDGALDAEEADERDPPEAVDDVAVVTIPRPDVAPEPVRPTPPIDTAAREQMPPTGSRRQQKLFGGGVDEDLIEEARDVMRSGRRLTAALLQRKLRIDYELAHELLQVLAQRGLIAADDES
ncbi:MAG: hypothetical protein KAI24_12135 [Planctomycetes bacterium]|nr:hypothetical protein [Planctomycetota bacterium]